MNILHDFSQNTTNNLSLNDIYLEKREELGQFSDSFYDINLPKEHLYKLTNLLSDPLQSLIDTSFPSMKECFKSYREIESDQFLELGGCYA